MVNFFIITTFLNKIFKDFTVYDVRSIDSDEVFLSMGDDCLIKFVFGGLDTPKRNTLYLDSPEISTSFLKTFLTVSFNFA